MPTVSWCLAKSWLQGCHHEHSAATQQNAASIAPEAASGEQYLFPMTLTQQAFWYLDRTSRGNPAWNIAVRFEVRGRVDTRLLQQAVAAMAARQDALRTTFRMGLSRHGRTSRSRWYMRRCRSSWP